MMPLIIFIVIIVVGVAIFLTAGSDPVAKRKQALESLAKLLGTTLQQLEGYENSFKLTFNYKGREFAYEDTEEKGFQDQSFKRGMLRLKTPVMITMGFSERDAGSVKENVTSFRDINSPWMQNVGKVVIPKELQRFNIFTNSVLIVNRLFVDEQALKIFEKFKNVDPRGHPVMSLEVVDGVIILKFHAVSGLKPSLFTLHNNVSSIEEYLDKLIMISDKIEEVYRQLKTQNMLGPESGQ